MTNPRTTSYALFKNGTQESKAHSTIQAVIIEAYEREIIIREHADFIGKEMDRLSDGYEIREARSSGSEH